MKRQLLRKKQGAIVISQENKKMLNINKNVGFEHASGEWILNLDADEVVAPELAEEIKKIITNNPSENGFWIRRKNILFGKWIQHGLWYPDKQLRLFRKSKGKFPCVHVHEYIAVEGGTGDLQGHIHHTNYETISQFLYKMDTLYTESEVSTRMSAGYILSWMDAIRFPVADFVKVYFSQKGYQDGLHGLVLSLLQSFYALVVFAKLWEKNQFVDVSIAPEEITKELRGAKKEVSYWMLTHQLETTSSGFKKVWLKICRKYVTLFQ
jgi:(heptosyl)LPS beta-1,4-glucosyltransferase